MLTLAWCFRSGLADKKGNVRVFYGLDSEYSGVAVVSLGKPGVGYNAAEEIEEGKENVRIAVAGSYGFPWLKHLKYWFK